MKFKLSQTSKPKPLGLGNYLGPWSPQVSTTNTPLIVFTNFAVLYSAIPRAMGCRDSNFTPISFYLLLLSPLCFCSIITTSSELVTVNPFQDVCSLVNCGQGTCKASNASVLGFVCDCHPGWREIQLGPFTFPSCLLPNCTVDFYCGNRYRSPSPPSSLAPVLPPSKNLFSPCGLVWCGDGTCVTNGTGYTCQCNQGSENLLNSYNLVCFKTCYFGADCSSLGLSLPSVPPPQIPQPPPSSNPNSASKDTPGTNLPNVVVEMIISNQSAPSSQSR